MGSPLLAQEKEALCEGVFEENGPQFALSFATFAGQGATADGGDYPQPHLRVHSQERLFRRLRRSKAQEGRKKVHAAVDTLGELLAFAPYSAKRAQEREQRGELAQAIQERSAAQWVQLA